MDNSLEGLRLQLLANGYSPIRNRDKATYLKDWPDLEITEDVIRSWTRMGRDKATGLRLDDGLACIDVDVDDADMVKALFNAMLDIVPRLDRDDVPLLVRSSGRAKEAWFFRTAEPFGRLHTRRWTKPGETIDDGTHVVEVFGGASARQMGAFGPHTVERDGTVTRSYAWLDDESPLTVPLDRLPELTKSEFAAIVDKADALMAEAGWTFAARTTIGENTAERVYDLTEDMIFDMTDGMGQLTLVELRALVAGGEEGLRCSASWLEGPDPKRSPTRCLVTATRAGHVAIWDSATGVTHIDAAEAPAENGRGVNEALLRLKTAHLEKLSERVRDARLNKIHPDDDARAAAAKLLRSHAYCANQTNAVIPIWTNSVTDGITLKAFRELTYPNHSEELGQRGGVKKITPADVWLGASSRVTVAGVRMRPDMPRPTYVEDGQTFINAYQPVVHTAKPEGMDVFHDFMVHLLPTLEERTWFLQWLSNKMAHPDIPGAGVLMVAKKQGAGRGTLFAIIRGLFGSSYVRKVDAGSLTGDGSQSQYTTWMANSLFVLVDEIFDGGTGLYLGGRKKAYNRIKTLIDPASRDVEIVQKTQNNYVTRTFAAFLMATNNANAMPLENDDRRLGVLTNGMKLADNPGLAARLNAYRDGADFTAGFLSGVVEYLAGISMEGFNPYDAPPMFKGKSDMVEHNMTEGMEAAEEALRQLPGDFVTRNAFIDRACRISGEGSRHDRNKVAEARQAIEQSDWVFLGRVRIAENGSKAQVWARNEAAAEVWRGSSHAERGSLLAPNEGTAVLSDLQARALALGLKPV